MTAASTSTATSSRLTKLIGFTPRPNTRVRPGAQQRLDGLDPVGAADIVWVLNDPGMYHQFVHQRGWTLDSYQAWLADTLIAQLLPRP